MNTRAQEIGKLWEHYQGLYIALGILIGIMLFPLLDLLITNVGGILEGLVPEAIGITFTVLILDRVYEKREISRLKKRLIREARSQSNETAKVAIDWMHEENWIAGDHGLLRGAQLRNAKLKGANLRFSNLAGADLFSADLQQADLFNAQLQRSKLRRANLEGARLPSANLNDADLREVNLRDVDLLSAELENADLFNANMEGANLSSANLHKTKLDNANLRNARLRGANLQDTVLHNAILPDGSIWIPNTDMERFTTARHPDFWSPE